MKVKRTRVKIADLRARIEHLERENRELGARMLDEMEPRPTEGECHAFGQYILNPAPHATWRTIAGSLRRSRDDWEADCKRAWDARDRALEVLGQMRADAKNERLDVFASLLIARYADSVLQALRPGPRQSDVFKGWTGPGAEG